MVLALDGHCTKLLAMQVTVQPILTLKIGKILVYILMLYKIYMVD